MKRWALLVLLVGCPASTAPLPVVPPPVAAIDAGSTSYGCKAVCAKVDVKLHCNELWAGASSCSSGCAALVASGVPSSHLRACWVAAKTTNCTQADACKEHP